MADRRSAVCRALCHQVRAEKKEAQAADYGAEGMSLGICLGLCLEVPFGNNSGIGIAVGTLIDLAIGTRLRRAGCNESNDNMKEKAA